MTNFNYNYISSAKLILQLHEPQVKTWAADQSNPELATACQMLIQAGKQVQQVEK